MTRGHRLLTGTGSLLTPRPPVTQLAPRKQDLPSMGLLHPHLLSLSVPAPPPPSLCISVKLAPSSDNLVWRPTTTPCQAARARAALSPTDVLQTSLTRPSLKSHAGQHTPRQWSQAEIYGFYNIKTSPVLPTKER